ncbi:HlyD family efflux transporter periplasmic adaptor subunit [Thalassotalea psychrophila]|uniref:HlyD family efflux transporter periplasmic adaptor subunit n=1 Tax=Thalassotalea psychrophila TaxID=3065647 RepID=A0ABY9TXG7_9GAMM|nr:HlyD family efflux transporter periplasmic adaptor subunit [Colwelliaceae bacterium SQ149]
MGTITPMEQTSKGKKEIKMPTKKANSTSKAVSGAGMDRKVTRKQNPLKKWSGVVIIALAIVYLGYQFITSPSGRSLSVDQNRIVVSKVTSGTFEDFIPVRGRVTPAKTVYLDAIEGGRVERILVEDGADLSSGDLIVELSNASLQLNVLGNEARVAEQLNNMRSIELSLEQNRLQHKSNLVDINYQIKMLTRQLQREQQLVTTGSVAQTKFDDTSDTLQWYKNRLTITLESQASDTRMQSEQLVFLKETSKRLEGNLEISRKNLENMNVRAPVNGKLSGFNVEVGQSIGRGERLGQIDTPNDYKLTANIDEFYLGRVDLGQKAQFDNYQLVISKIYPQVQNGQFEVDFKFIGEQPSGIRRGQTIQTKLTLGDETKALLIPNGAFFQDTGGNWIFVVTADQSQAVKRTVRLGRRNSRFIEVLDGLEEGEQVVTSPYSSYQDMDRLNLSN